MLIFSFSCKHCQCFGLSALDSVLWKNRCSYCPHSTLCCYAVDVVVACGALLLLVGHCGLSDNLIGFSSSWRQGTGDRIPVDKKCMVCFEIIKNTLLLLNFEAKIQQHFNLQRIKANFYNPLATKLMRILRKYTRTA